MQFLNYVRAKKSTELMVAFLVHFQRYRLFQITNLMHN